MSNKIINTIDDLIKFIDGNLDIDNKDRLIGFLEKAKNPGYSVVDPNDPQQSEDDADKWLKENESIGDTKKSSYKDWEASHQYSPDEQKKINDMMRDGWNEREAASHLNIDKNIPKTLEHALSNKVHPNMPSDKSFSVLKPLAKEWLKNAKTVEARKADISKNPIIAADQYIKDARDAHYAKYNTDKGKFLDSIKSLSGRDRHKSIQDFHNKWNQDNPQHQEGLKNLSAAQQKHSEAWDAASKTLQEQLDYMVHGDEPREGFSEQAAAQMVGGKDDADDKQRASKVFDPLQHFKHKNPKLIESLLANHQDRQDRLKHIQSARVMQEANQPKVEHKPTAMPQQSSSNEVLKQPDNQKMIQNFMIHHAPLINLQMKKLKDAGQIPPHFDDETGRNELVLAGFKGLMHAMDKYDHQKAAKISQSDNPFKAFANETIRGHMATTLNKGHGVSNVLKQQAKNQAFNEKAVKQPNIKTDGKE